MNLTLRRHQFLPDGVFGEILDDHGDHLFVTLEHSYNQLENNWYAKIAPGKYTCKRRRSPRFGFDVFQVMNVPGHSMIEIHPGNWDRDSDGCILIGYGISHSGQGIMVTDSRNAFKDFMNLQAGLNEFQLVVG